jgi:hypothetical protein
MDLRYRAHVTKSVVTWRVRSVTSKLFFFQTPCTVVESYNRFGGTRYHRLQGSTKLTPRSRVFLEKLTGPQLVKNSPAFYGTRRFITAFITACYLSLSWARSIHSMPPSHFLKIHYILPSHLSLCLASGLLPSGFPTQTPCAPLPILAKYPAHLSLFYFINRMIFGEEYGA